MVAQGIRVRTWSLVVKVDLFGLKAHHLHTRPFLKLPCRWNAIFTEGFLLEMFVGSVSLLGAAEPWTLRACCIIEMSNVTKVEDVGQLLVMVCGCGFVRSRPLLIWFAAICVMELT